jgi:hypothetical protein
MDDLINKLRAPFDTSEIEVRVGSVSNDGSSVMPLFYLTARAVMNRMDEVFGLMGWSSHLTQVEGGLACTLTVIVEGEQKMVMDVAPFSDFEGLKGAASGAMKRAAVHLGIGRYLYWLPSTWVPVCDKKPGAIYFKTSKTSGHFMPPQLPSWALPKGTPKVSGGNMIEASRQSLQKAEAAKRKKPPAGDELDMTNEDEEERAAIIEADKPEPEHRPDPKKDPVKDGVSGQAKLLGRAIGNICWNNACDKGWPCEEHALCPECHGEMYDNRDSKKSPKMPDFKCRKATWDKETRTAGGCPGVWWPHEWKNKCEEAKRETNFEFDDIPFGA